MKRDKSINNHKNTKPCLLYTSLYLYEFKLFCRKPVRFAQKDFNVYLNAVDIPFEKLDALLKDLDLSLIHISGSYNIHL